MKICHVCSAHSVDDGRVFHKECVSLASKGYDVHLIATGEGLEAYNSQGVTLHPLLKAQSRQERLKRRTLVARLAASMNPDLFHVHEPELLGPVIAIAKGRPVIWDVHESYLDVLLDRHWIPHILRPFLRFWWDHYERQLVKRCAGIVVVTTQIAQRYKALHQKVQTIANYPDLKAIIEFPAPSRDGKTCIYAGTIAENRGIPVIFQALSILKQRGLAIPFKLAGRPSTEDYLHWLLKEAETLGVRELVQYVGAVSLRDSLLLQHNASISLLPSMPYGNNLTAIPVKMIECMALGLPVIYSNLPNHEEIAAGKKMGIGIDVTQPEQMADAIELLANNPDLARQMGEIGQNMVKERLNWNSECVKLLTMYEEILGQTS